jgi:thioredoxin 1
MEDKMFRDLDDTNFDSEVAEGIAIIDFWAPWCGPCKQMTPVMQKLAEGHPQYIVGKVDIDKSPDIASRFNIMSIPTVVILKNGQPVEQCSGVVSEKVILDKVKSVE